MDFSNQQEQALEKIGRWLNSGGTQSQIFRMFGYAGTGKTTIAQYVAKAHDVRFAAYTGKAATVMRSKGCNGASTIHSMIYRSKGQSTEWLERLEADFAREQAKPAQDETRLRTLAFQIAKAKADLRGPAFSRNEEAFADGRPDVICIDECSMVDERVGLDVLSFGIPILVIGDPAQLPPVRGAGFFTQDRPDVLLTEIHRQARGNPIIELATAVREGRPLPAGAYGSSFVGRRSEVSVDAYMDADQILCGRNATRHALNRRMRERMGWQGLLPMVREKVVCLRNNHDLGLMNGSVWEVKNIDPCPRLDTFKIAVTDGTIDVETEAHKGAFLGAQELDWQERTRADEFDFAYAMTVHKFQGSQANKVILFDEWTMENTRQQWRYTGITRAAESITVVS